jgi:hypothetical protein
VEMKRKTAVILLDLKKAFVCLNFDILEMFLQEIGIIGKAQGSFSEKENITCGVPQGITLGPYLFLIYINKMLSLQLNGHIQCFADDTALVYSSEDFL